MQAKVPVQAVKAEPQASRWGGEGVQVVGMTELTRWPHLATAC